MRFKNCEIKCSKENGVITIESIVVPKDKRGLGWARRAMTMLMKKYAEKDMDLHAYGQDDTTTTAGLVEFYKSFGFVVEAGDDSFGYEMVRK